MWPGGGGAGSACGREDGCRAGEMREAHRDFLPGERPCGGVRPGVARCRCGGPERRVADVEPRPRERSTGSCRGTTGRCATRWTSPSTGGRRCCPWPAWPVGTRLTWGSGSQWRCAGSAMRLRSLWFGGRRSRHPPRGVAFRPRRGGGARPPRLPRLSALERRVARVRVAGARRAGPGRLRRPPRGRRGGRGGGRRGDGRRGAARLSLLALPRVANALAVGPPAANAQAAVGRRGRSARDKSRLCGSRCEERPRRRLALRTGRRTSTTLSPAKDHGLPESTFCDNSRTRNLEYRSRV